MQDEWRHSWRHPVFRTMLCNHFYTCITESSQSQNNEVIQPMESLSDTPDEDEEPYDLEVCILSECCL